MVVKIKGWTFHETMWGRNGKCPEGHYFDKKDKVCHLKPIKVGDRVLIGNDVMSYHERFIGKTGFVTDYHYHGHDYKVQLEGSYEDFWTHDVMKLDDQRPRKDYQFD